MLTSNPSNQLRDEIAGQTVRPFQPAVLIVPSKPIKR